MTTFSKKRHLALFGMLMLLAIDITVQAQYMDSIKSYDPDTPDNKVLILPPAGHKGVDPEKFSTSYGHP